MGPTTQHSAWAWVTFCHDENEAEKAIILAESLKGVYSAAKRVVITSSMLPENIRGQLYNHFDLVSLMDESAPKDRDYVKVFAFSLTLFQGCVYLPPNSLVLKKCDELFSNNSLKSGFVGLPSLANPFMYWFKPSIEHFQCLKSIWKCSANGETSFIQYVQHYAKNNSLKVAKLDDKFCQQLQILEGKLYDGFAKDVAVINFGSADPKNLNGTSSHRLGLLEKFAINRWWSIYGTELHGRVNSNGMDFKQNSDQFDNDPIAIIGMSCRYPGANSLDEFWELLIEGREGIRQLPSHRWRKGETIAVASPKNRKATAGFLDFPIDEFDAKFFGISPKEAEFLDPQQRLLHELSWEALENASIDPLSLRGSHTGVFVGSWLHEYKDLAVKAIDRDFFRIYMGNSLAATTSRLSHFYKVTGPSIATESGCSSAIVAVDMACKSLRNRETNLAFAGGVNLFLHPFDQQTMSFVLAPDGRCKTFDAKADGFGRAEGAGVLILKRMSDAIANGDKIWALIRGSAVSQEGVSKSIGTPTVHCESLAMELALKDANVLPKEVSFVEAHGTGTSVGDPMEMAAITKVYSEGRTEPLWIGSVKTNIGHTEAASGITGIIKVVLSMKNEVIPPHLNFTSLNPEINLDTIPARIPLEPTVWRKKLQGPPRIAGVSSFGISGTDGHVIMQEPPTLDTDLTSRFHLKLSRPLHIMKIAAKTSEALDILLRKYETMLESEISKDDGNLFEDIAYTANVGRATYNHKAVIVAKDSLDALKTLKGNSYKRKEVHGGMEAKICFLFTGQGSQYHGMAYELYKTSPVFRTTFDKCDSLLQSQYKIDIRNVMWSMESEDISQDKGLLNRTIYSQIAIFVVEYCLMRLWTSWGIMPHFVLGHSLGEFAAAVSANIFDLESALTMVVHRSLLIDGLPQGKMLVVKADKEDVYQLLTSFQKEGKNGFNRDMDFAAVNSPDQTVLAGDSEVIGEFSEFCSRKEVKNIVLAATHAFHSKHMEPILPEYRRILRNVIGKCDPNSTPCQYISGMEGKLITDLDEIRNPEYWIRHTREKVNFIEASEAALDSGCNIFLEIGPSPVLSTFIMANASNMTGLDFVCLPSLRKNHGEWTTLLESLSKLFLSDFANVNIDWGGFDQYYKRDKVDLPFYPFNKKKIWVKFRTTPGEIHPLVGHLLSNASKSTIYEGEFTLKKLNYLNDHAIGTTVIFPGAALLEMCIVAGHSTVQGLLDEFSRPSRPITIKGMRIEAPLALQDGKACILQTVVDINEKDEDGLGYTVKVYNWFKNKTDGVNSNDGQWKSHAFAHFLPLVMDEEKSRFGKIDIVEMQEKWEKLSATKDLYEKLNEVGFSFGPIFQSLACGWRKGATDAKVEADDGILFEVKVPSDTQGAYLVHPVILDAMLQATMVYMNKEKLHKKLYVPVCVDEFTWLSDGSGDSSRYIYCKNVEKCSNESESKGVTPRRRQLTTFLLDGSGTVLASMCGIECIETTVKLVESIIQQQSYVMPQLWEEIWKPKEGPLDRRVVAAKITSDVENTSLSREVVKTCEKLNEMDENELNVYRHLNNLTVLYFVNALYKLGWVPKQNERIVLKEFMTRFGIVDVAWHFMKYFFTELAHEGVIEVEDADTFIVKELPETRENIEMLCMNLVQEGEASRGDYRVVSEIGKRLPDFLLGKSSPLTTLFPEEPSAPHLGTFYDSIRHWVSQTGNILNNALTNYNHLFYTKDNKDSVTFRVLEVGAGTGSATKDIIDFLVDKEVNFEYTFTDLSAAFFINAEVKFEKYKKDMKFKKFNIEEDPIAQGFTPEYYDLIVACEVIHATKDIRQTLSNLRLLLKTNGHIQITETTKPDRRITLLVGLLEGYWRFTDKDLRPCHATLSKEKWVDVLNTKSLGYKFATSIGCYNDVHSYIFAFASEDYSLEHGTNSVFDKMQLINTKIISDSDPEPQEQNQYSWLIFCDDSETSKEIQRRLKCLNRNVVLINKGQYYSKKRFDPETGRKKILKTLRRLEGEFFEGIIYFWALTPKKNEDDQEQLSLPFLHICQGMLELHKVTSRLYVFTQGTLIGQEDFSCTHPEASTIWGIAKALRNEQPDISMHCVDLSSDKPLTDQINHMFYELFWTNDGEELIAFRDGKRNVPRLSSLKILDESLTLPSFCERFQLLLPATKAISDLEFGFLNKYNLNEDEIEIQIKAAALNFRDIFAVLKPISQFDSINSIGSDFAGVVTKIGSKVTKWKVGDPVFGMNTEQQALPSHVKTKQNMVIPVPENLTFAEAATIPAVFATALYCLVSVAKIKRGDVILIHTASGGVGLSAVQIAQHFGATIIATAGSRRKRAYLKSLGIEHVFHSRSTEYEEDIRKVTAGRGVDIVLNSLTGPGFKEASLNVCSKHARFVEMSKLNIWRKEEVQQLRNDVDYTVADLSSLEEEEWKDLLEKMMKAMEEKFVQPIPYVRYDALNIRQALGFLQKAKHIGKVVCIMPENMKLNNKDISGPNSTPKINLFNDRSTYIITGGLGGIGFEVAKFMLDSGAKHLVLVGRSPPKPEIEKVIQSWNKDEGSRKHVEAWQADVGDYQQLKEMLEKIKTVPTQWPPLRGIMHAAGVLHDGTLPNQTWTKFMKTYNAKLNGTWNLHNLTRHHQLEHFVLFSSVTSLFGSPGQSNHSASNAFEDALAHYRHSNGLPATTINWANWGECGVAQDIDFPGIRPIATTQGLRALEAILKSNRLQSCVMNVDSFGLVAKLFPKVKGYVDDKRLLGDVKAPTLIINTDQFWADVDKAEGKEEKIKVFKGYIKNMLKNNLKLEADEVIEDSAEFQSLGVDSLMLLEMKNYLQNLFGDRLTLTAAHLKDCNTPEALATRLVDILEGRKNEEDESEDEGESNNEANLASTELEREQEKFEGIGKHAASAPRVIVN